MAEHRTELQSIRGIAAVVVAVSHCSFYYNYDPDLKLGAEAAFNAHAAVICFFVLSGFVLTLSLERMGLSSNSIANFFVRRVFRIYPALWVAVLLALSYPVLLAGHPFAPTVDPWWGETSRSYPSPFTVAGALSGVATSLKVPVWTLYVELAGSALMPLLVLCLKRGALVFGVVTIGLSVLSQIDTWPVLLSPAPHLVFFALGAGMTRAEPLIKDMLRSPGLVVIAAIGCFLILWFGRWAFDARFLVNYSAPLPALLEGVSAALLIGIVYFSPVSFPFLRQQWAARLGDISYSAYLFHLPILGWLAFLLGELMGFSAMNDPLLATVVTTATTLVATLFVSSLSYRFVELPGIRLGRTVAESLLTGPARLRG